MTDADEGAELRPGQGQDVGAEATPGGAGAYPPPPAPSSRRARWRKAEKEQRRQARESVRYPVFTRSVLVWMLIFALTGVAFGASGAFWWASFDSQISDLRRDTSDFGERSAAAQDELEGLRDEALGEIDAALSPLQGFLSESQMLQLAETYSPSLVAVATLDEGGQPSVGTGFAVISNDRETFYLTSYKVVEASSLAPGPAITVRRGGEELAAQLWNWDPGRDMALLRVEAPDAELLEWADDGAMGALLGRRVFPVSAVGGAGAALTAGMVIDLSAAGLQHTAPVGAAFRGAPIVNVEGRVVAVTSTDYQPLGFDPGPQIHFAVPVADVCRSLISCGANRSAPAPSAPSPSSSTTSNAPPG